MEKWRLYFNWGRNHLCLHEPQKAIKKYTQAINLCPPTRHKELATLLFYSGIALKRLGLTNNAIKVWTISQKINKNPYIRKMIKRFTNGYGMKKQVTDKEDDWKAFFCIQVARYLSKKNKKCFSCTAEKDMIKDLIQEHWKFLCKRCILDNKSWEEKYNIFQRVKIIFPYLVIPRIIGNLVIHVDFNSGNRLKGGDRCLCGSGLPYSLCCGRTLSEEELRCGVF